MAYRFVSSGDSRLIQEYDGSGNKLYSEVLNQNHVCLAQFDPERNEEVLIIQTDFYKRKLSFIDIDLANSSPSLTGETDVYGIQDSLVSNGFFPKAPSSGGGGAVDSVNGQTGVVSLTTSDISESGGNLYFSSTEQTKLSGIEDGAQVNVVDSVNGQTGVVSLQISDLTDVTSGTVLTTSNGNKTTTVDFGTYFDDSGSATLGDASVLRAGEAHFENVKIAYSFGLGPKNYFVALDSNNGNDLRIGQGISTSGNVVMNRRLNINGKITLGRDGKVNITPDSNHGLTVSRSSHVIESLNASNQVGWLFRRFSESSSVFLSTSGDVGLNLESSDDIFLKAPTRILPGTNNVGFSITSPSGYTSNYLEIKDNTLSNLYTINSEGYHTIEGKLRINSDNTSDRPLSINSSEAAGQPLTWYGRRNGYSFYIDINDKTNGNLGNSDISVVNINTGDILYGIGADDGTGANKRPLAWNYGSSSTKAFFSLTGEVGKHLSASETLARISTNGSHTGNILEIGDETSDFLCIDTTKINLKKPLRLEDIPTYADDSSAGTGGLSAGDVYKTSTGELRIKI